ncbi:MAG TPA: TRAP transporter substrate-binding protein DctP, partial [Alphaproteobacteria bacterium]|nr:TRAP transporter substrate-binding protein DctP [Alphaproteobacteria bacterium]
VEVGHGTVFSTVPLPDAKAAKVLKVRLPPTKAATLFWHDVGAAGVPMGVVDMVPALKTGQVNAIYTSTVYGIAIGLPKLAPHLIYNALGADDIGTVTVSKKTWKDLSETQRQALLGTAKYVDALRKGIRGAEQALLAKVKKAGGEVTRPSGAAEASWRAHAQATWDALVGETGGNAPEIWQKIQAAKKACSSS